MLVWFENLVALNLEIPEVGTKGRGVTPTD